MHMSIKQRLVVSNILMIVVPVAVALVLLFGCNELYWRVTYGLYAHNYLLWRLGYRSAVSYINIITVVGVLISVLIANHYLSKYVIKKIREPILLLSQTVSKLGEGDLSCRIPVERKDEFAELFTAFNQMAARLETSVNKQAREEENRRELMMNISHDLRSPLTSIRAYVEGLLDGVASTPEARTRYLNTIREKAQEIDGMVNKIFLFSKLDCGEFGDHPERLDLKREMTELMNVLGPEYEQKGLVIQVEARESCPIVADTELLHRVMVNLIDNAWKYKNKDPGHLKILLGKKDKSCILAFLDDGPGVPPDALPHIFEVFYRADASRAPQKGSGLGLAIVYKAVARMGGRVRAQNSPEGGLSVEIQLPLEEGSPCTKS